MIRRILLLTFASCAIANQYSIANEPMSWGESGTRTRWDVPPEYTRPNLLIVASSPSLTECSDLIAFAKSSQPGYERDTVVSKLRTISRCDFFDRFDDDKKDYVTAIKRWDDWWNRYGSELSRLLPQFGRTYPEAWRLVAPADEPNCPRYSILVPNEWSSTIEFRYIGGIGGRYTREVLEISVKDRACSLVRKYQHQQFGRTEPWVREHWKGIETDEASRFLAALIYAIDNPWVYANDNIKEEHPDKAILYGRVRGRPLSFSSILSGQEFLTRLGT